MEVPFLVCNFVIIMEIAFTKYHGTGNDFIIIDDRDGKIIRYLTSKKIAALCARRFGIGADGLILISSHKTSDFSMIYFNADGNESTMCGNGGRCLVHFANSLGVFQEKCTFMAIDGLHEAKVQKNQIYLKMSNVSLPKKLNRDYFLNTGSPHHVRFVDNLEEVDVLKKGRGVRYGKRYQEKGVNVNFVEVDGKGLKVGTYERGVEDETYSCGTGVVASAIATHYSKKIDSLNFKITTKGGSLKVKFKMDKNQYKDVWLIGPAVVVSRGVVDL